MFIRMDLRPDARKLRQFGWASLAAFGLLGTVTMWRGTLFGVSLGALTDSVAYACWSLGLLSVLFSLAWPPGNRPLYLSLGVIAFPIGWLLSHVILALVFFAVLTPVAFVFRLIGRDPLAREIDTAKPSYWDDLPQLTDKSEYFRQF